MTLPGGDLVRSRVVPDAGRVLSGALDRDLTGYAVLEPQDALLLDGDPGYLAFESGVPVAARHPGSGREGSAALAALAVPGPCRVELYELPPGSVREWVDPGARIAPDTPAERLAGDPDLAARTRRSAPAGAFPDDTGPGAGGEGGSGHARDGDGNDAVAAFLDDEERIAEIRERAREEARECAEEWGLTDQLDG